MLFGFSVLITVLSFLFGCANENPLQPATPSPSATTSRIPSGGIKGGVSDEGDVESTVIFGDILLDSGGLVNPIQPTDLNAVDVVAADGEIVPDEIRDPLGEEGDDTAPQPDVVEGGEEVVTRTDDSNDSADTTEPDDATTIVASSNTSDDSDDDGEIWGEVVD